jgi:DNA-binding LacI/PurR family transcriptional regulator
VGFNLMQQLIQQSPRITAVVVAANLPTIGAIQALHAAGRKMPYDISFVGYGHHGFMAWPSISMTRVMYPSAEIGEQAARLLLLRLGGNDAPQTKQRVALVPELEIGTTSGPAPAESVSSGGGMESA